MKPIFYCPNCRVSLTKSPQAQVLGELYSGGSSFFAMGDMPDHINCPGCRGEIDTMKMIKGEYDNRPFSAYDLVMLLAVLGGFFALLPFAAWWLALIGGILTGGITMKIIEAVTGKKILQD